jgi:hypothetical protein
VAALVGETATCCKETATCCKALHCQCLDRLELIKEWLSVSRLGGRRGLRHNSDRNSDRDRRKKGAGTLDKDMCQHNNLVLVSRFVTFSSLKRSADDLKSSRSGSAKLWLPLSTVLVHPEMSTRSDARQQCHVQHISCCPPCRVYLCWHKPKCCWRQAKPGWL